MMKNGYHFAHHSLSIFSSNLQQFPIICPVYSLPHYAAFLFISYNSLSTSHFSHSLSLTSLLCTHSHFSHSLHFPHSISPTSLSPPLLSLFPNSHFNLLNTVLTLEQNKSYYQKYKKDLQKRKGGYALSPESFAQSAPLHPISSFVQLNGVVIFPSPSSLFFLFFSFSFCYFSFLFFLFFFFIPFFSFFFFFFLQKSP
jgi:hypothetical protein